MSSTITVPDIDPSDKAWLQAEAKRVGLSMESYVRKMIEERHAKTQQKEKPNVRIVGKDRVLSPVDNTWDSFFLSEEHVSDDFMEERASQEQSEREAF